VLDPLLFRLFGRALKETTAYRRWQVRKRLGDFRRSRPPGTAQQTSSLISLVGHPFAPTGRGEDVRSCYRALCAVDLPAQVVDVHGLDDPGEDLLNEFWYALSERVGSGVNIFFINADEVEPVLAELTGTGRFTGDGYNIICPVWELSSYPPEWARHLERFDEIWVPTRFIRDAIAPRVQRPVFLMPFASTRNRVSAYSRAYFGIPQDHYVFLNFFDVSSRLARKNPNAVLEAFALFRKDRPQSKAILIMKVLGSRAHRAELSELLVRLSQFDGQAFLLTKVMSVAELTGLMECCDCFVSLHRSEGFGRGLSEAMSLGKPVIATGYSGNLDYMDKGNALLVDYDLIPVAPDQYPFGEGQVWAEADVDHAALQMRRLYDEPDLGRSIGSLAFREIRETNGYRTVGGCYKARLDALRRGLPYSSGQEAKI
jgi:glycosyltransferase involved in cell wall biosynthesis